MEEKYNIDELINRPLNTLSESEAEFVIEWKINAKVKEREYIEAIEQKITETKNQTEILKKCAKETQDVLDTLVYNALEFYDKVNNHD